MALESRERTWRPPARPFRAPWRQPLLLAAVMGGAGLIVVFTARTRASVPIGGRVQWSERHAEALDQARAAGRPAMLYFVAEWSLGCRRLDAVTFSDRRVIEASHDVERILVNCTKPGAHLELRRRYNVRGFPTVILLDGRGRKVGLLRSRDPEFVAAELRALIADR